MVGFIDAHRNAHGVEPICNVLPIAPSTYYDHLAKRADPVRLSDRARLDEALRPEIRRVFEESWRVYGVRKIWHQLRREGFDVARCTVARLMKSMGIQGIIRGKPHRTTIPDRKAPCPLDKVNRQFRVPAPNMLWVSDFTYVTTWKGFVYVAPRHGHSDQWRSHGSIIDAYARKIVGWRVSNSAHAPPVHIRAAALAGSRLRGDADKPGSGDDPINGIYRLSDGRISPVLDGLVETVAAFRSAQSADPPRRAYILFIHGEADRVTPAAAYLADLAAATAEITTRLAALGVETRWLVTQPAGATVSGNDWISRQITLDILAGHIPGLTFLGPLHPYSLADAIHHDARAKILIGELAAQAIWTWSRTCPGPSLTQQAGRSKTGVTLLSASKAIHPWPLPPQQRTCRIWASPCPAMARQIRTGSRRPCWSPGTGSG